jgi:hypothetical protein
MVGIIQAATNTVCDFVVTTLDDWIDDDVHLEREKEE